jgi:hypothetical protein
LGASRFCEERDDLKLIHAASSVIVRSSCDEAIQFLVVASGLLRDNGHAFADPLIDLCQRDRPLLLKLCSAEPAAVAPGLVGNSGLVEGTPSCDAS